MTIQIDENTVEVDGVRYKRGHGEHKWMPKRGQLIQVRDYYDETWKTDIFECYNYGADIPVFCEYSHWKYARPITDDKLLIGRTFAPEGARWFAPWSPDIWVWFTACPRVDSDGYYKTTVDAHTCGTMSLPTGGELPIKLWEDEE